MQVGPLLIEHAPLRLIPRRVRAVMAEDRARRRAARLMPRPASWEWAESRLLPLLAGPYLDSPRDRLVRSISPIGCALIYAVAFEGAFLTIDQDVSQRWERTPDDLYRTGMANLRRRATGVTPRAVVGGTLEGRYFRRILAPVGCASSLVLVPAELTRLLGSDPQILATPTRDTLLAFALDTPAPVAARITVDIEAGHPWPLMLDPFALVEGEVSWQTELDGLDDDWDDREPAMS